MIIISQTLTPEKLTWKSLGHTIGILWYPRALHRAPNPGALICCTKEENPRQANDRHICRWQTKRNAVIVSIADPLVSRCGLEPDNRFEHEEFLNIFDFSTSTAVTDPGMAADRISGQVVWEIEVTIKNYEREKIEERTQSNVSTDLHEERGLPDPRPDGDRDTGGSETSGQVQVIAGL